MALGYWCIPIMNCNSENAQQKYISNKITKNTEWENWDIKCVYLCLFHVFEQFFNVPEFNV